MEPNLSGSTASKIESPHEEPRHHQPPEPHHEEGLQSTPPSSIHIKWHESWIMRAAAMAAFILLLGYAVSAFFTFESIETIAKLAHDPAVEQSLSTSLENIKKIHELQQQITVERLEPLLNKMSSSQQKMTSSIIVSLLEQVGLGLNFDLTQINIQPFESRPEGLTGPIPDNSKKEIKWLARDRLRLGDYVVDFPHGNNYEAFKSAEDLYQRYQLVGLKLRGNIIPTLIKVSATVLIVSFFVLASLFIVYAQRFKAGITEVIEGFVVWAEKDSKFRFADLYPGELKLITNQFNNMADEVESNRQRSLYLEKIASWQIIARKLAHEIKNPLTPIQMMVSQLKRRYRGDDLPFTKLLDEAQAIITEEITGLRRMVDNFSQFARLPEPKPQRADIVLACRHVIDLQKNMFLHHHFMLTSSKPAIFAEIDEDLIRQVILNVVKNAAEASQEREAHIVVDIADTPHEIIISITDDGAGIPPDMIDRIFEAYFTTKHTGPTPGMGLGLAVCQKIVMDHQGTMSVRSRPGVTVFTIKLPRVWKK